MRRQLCIAAKQERLAKKSTVLTNICKTSKGITYLQNATKFTKIGKQLFIALAIRNILRTNLVEFLTKSDNLSKKQLKFVDCGHGETEQKT